MSAAPVPHGYHLDPDLHNALRGEPPVETLAWVCSEVGATSVVDVQALDGGTSSAVHKIVLSSPGGVTVPVVLRRYVLDWIVDEPWTPGNEADVLQLLAGSPVSAPQLIGADPDGSVTGTPTVLMSYLPGRTEWRPDDLDGWLRKLAEALPEIHAVQGISGLRGFAPYPPEQTRPPAWSRHPAAWEHAIELLDGPQPDVRQVFIHRDFHPGNVLWSDTQISGIIDWPSACRGPAEADIGHCRANLISHYGQDAADRFLAIWKTAAGTVNYDPYFDLTDVLSWTSGDDEPDPVLDEFVAAAAAQL